VTRATAEHAAADDAHATWRRATTRSAQPAFDLLALRGLGRVLRWRHSRTLIALPLFLLSVAMVLHGLLGPQIPERNLATSLTWVAYRGAVVLALVAIGNLFCLACPFMIPRELLRRFVRPRRSWPRALRRKWPAIVLFALFLFVYQLFDLWRSPLWTALLVVGYFAAAAIVDALFKQASFCKYVCPVGQFNFVASTLSPTELVPRDPETCVSCRTVDCLKGTRPGGRGSAPVRRGCELALFVPQKIGNMDCTLCLDCVYACPHDNIALAVRTPGAELWTDAPRSGIGTPSKRVDLGALALLFTFGALLALFATASPLAAVESAIGRVLGTAREAPALATIFIAALLLEPVILVGGAAWATRRLVGRAEMPLAALAARFAHALVPLGFGLWIAYYVPPVLAGAWTLPPAIGDALARVGIAAATPPRGPAPALAPDVVVAISMLVATLGVIGSLVVARRIAGSVAPERPLRAFAPWATLAGLLWLAATWLLGHPASSHAGPLGG
jgi:polyferredoxin